MKKGGERKIRTLKEIFMENELPLSGKSELDKKYEKAIEMCLIALTIDENVADIDDKNERKREYDKIDKAWKKAYSIFTELGEAGHSESLFKQGLCCLYGIAQPENNSNNEKAAELFRKASALGHKEAQKTLEEINN